MPNPSLARLSRLSAAEAASTLLREQRGVQRNAETLAWSYADSFDPTAPERKYFIDVVRHIVFGGEYPAVERSAFTIGDKPLDRPMAIER